MTVMQGRWRRPESSASPHAPGSPASCRAATDPSRQPRLTQKSNLPMRLSYLEQDLIALAGWRLGQEAPEFAHGLLIHGLSGISRGLAVPTGDHDDLAGAPIAQHQGAVQARGLRLSPRQEGLSGGGEFIDLSGLHPCGIDAGVHVIPFG